MTEHAPSRSLCVLIAVFNNAQGLRQSLLSLEREAESSTFDVLVVDDGSTDPILAESLVKPERGCLTVIRLPENRGLSAALNVGLTWLAKRNYQYVARLDAGDEVDNHRFKKQLSILEVDAECVLVASDVLFMEAGGSHLWVHRTPSDPAGIQRRLLYSNCLMHPSVTMRVAAVVGIGSYAAHAAVSEDYELFRRLSRVGTLRSIPEVLTKCRHYPGGISVQRRWAQRLERLRIQVRFFEGWSVHAYLGIARSIAAIAVPGRISEWRKAH